MRHVFIIAHARTGGTWLGTLLDASPNVKYLWEPDNAARRGHLGFPFFNLLELPDLTEGERVSRVLAFRNHAHIKPDFPKDEATTAVYKMTRVGGSLAASKHNAEGLRLFLRLRERLDGLVIHLVRHPVRWAASVQRWGGWRGEKLGRALRFFTNVTMAVREACGGEPWYCLVKHEDVVRETWTEARELYEFCGLKVCGQLARWVARTHAQDTPGSPHDHSTVMLKETLLDGWQRPAFAGRPAVAYANRLTAERWAGVYEALPGVPSGVETPSPAPQGAPRGAPYGPNSGAAGEDSPRCGMPTDFFQS